jgi:hypothetical protein
MSTWEPAMRLATTTINPVSFFLCPAHLFAGLTPDWEQVQEAYREAYEQARAVLRPAITDRLLAASWN